MVKPMLLLVLVAIILLALLLTYQWAAQKLGINTQSNSTQQPIINNAVLMDYRSVCTVLMRCVSRYHNAFMLDTAGNLADHLLGYRDGFYTENGQMYYVYRFQHRLDKMNVLEGHGRYDDTPAEDIMEMINGKLPQYSMAYYTEPLVICGAIDDDDGWIKFYVGRCI